MGIVATGTCVRNHYLIPWYTGYSCHICHWQWSSVPTDPCPGVKRYTWCGQRDGLLTREELRQRGRQPAAEAVGALWLAPVRWIWLYQPADVEPSPRRPPHCSVCGNEVRSQMPCRLCDQARLAEQVQLHTQQSWQQRRQDHEDAIRWPQDLLTSDLVILDSETTSLYPAEFVEVAVINGDGQSVFESRVAPEGAISAQAQAVHGISLAMLDEAPHYPSIHEQLCQAVQGKRVVIFNEAFDRKIWEHVCSLHQLVMPDVIGWECAMQAYARYCGAWSARHQSYTWQKLPGGTHSAKGDALATLALLQEMAAHPNWSHVALQEESENEFPF